jgi:hypothetical protein
MVCTGIAAANFSVSHRSFQLLAAGGRPRRKLLPFIFCLGFKLHTPEGFLVLSQERLS